MADLTPANENPWYVLMTLYGEQDEDKIDWELHQKNRDVWNAWAHQNPSDDTIAAATDAEVGLGHRNKWKAMEESVREVLAKRSSFLSYEDLPKATSAIDFSNTVFVKTLALNDLFFPQRVYFEACVFKRYAEFRSAVFLNDANFSSCHFEEDAVFAIATFAGRAHFRSITFSGRGYFAAAKFANLASFSSSSFTQKASFGSVEFKKAADFGYTKFEEGAVFSGAAFSGVAIFSPAFFSTEASFDSTRFLSKANFAGALFGSTIAPNIRPTLLDLSDAQFEKPANFRKARFCNRFPNFAGAILHEKTIFPFQKHSWPQGYQLFDDDWKSEEHDSKRIALMREAANSCAFLRHHVKGQGLPEAEYLFFKREMGFLAQIGGWWQRLPYRVFGLSDYGTSISKPAMGLGALWLVCALVYMVVLNWPGVIASELVPAGKGFGFSLANMFKFFGFQRTYYSELVQNMPNALQFLAAFQTAAAYVLIFFLGLGLRARFRLR